MHSSVVVGEWRSDLYSLDECGDELGGQTVGVVGYGAIGRRVADLLRAFGSDVLVHDPYASPDPGQDVELVDLGQLLRRAFLVSLHARATGETRGMIGKPEIAAMRRGSVLVNTARGSLADYEAVAAALHEGHLGGAAFDVFDEEPIPAGAPILSAPRVVFTPHLAGATRQTAERAAAMAAACVAAYLRSEPLPGLANPEAYDADHG